MLRHSLSVLGSLLSTGYSLGRLLSLQIWSITSCEIVHILLGALLLASGVLKGYQQFADVSFESSETGLPWMSFLFIAAESLFGVWLILSGMLRLASVAALIVFSIFACYSISRIAQGQTSCGCFGQITVPPLTALMIDLAALGLLLFTWPHSRCYSLNPIASSHKLPRRIAALSAAVVCCVIIGLAMNWLSGASLDVASSRVDHVAVLEPELRLGQQFVLLSDIDINADLSVGDWIVLLYHHDCNKCQLAQKFYRDEANRAGPNLMTTRIAFVEMPPFASEQEQSTPRCHIGRLASRKQWFVRSPVHIALSSGIVRAVSRDYLRPTEVVGSHDPITHGNPFHGGLYAKPSLFERKVAGTKGNCGVDVKPVIADLFVGTSVAWSG